MRMAILEGTGTEPSQPLQLGMHLVQDATVAT